MPSSFSAGFVSPIKSIQTVTTAGAGGTNLSATINAVDITKTIIVPAGTWDSTSASDVSSTMWTLVDATHVRSTGNATVGTDNINAKAYVVEFR